jgi:N6-L-threonylcarbamoyladenine synthase
MNDITILAIESSCDDTSAAIIRNGIVLSNVIAGQKVHEEYGGVVPELASRSHQENIVPVIDMALKNANISKKEISAVGFTRGPGLLGSLLVGTSFAKGFALSLDVPLIEVNHLQAHLLASFLEEEGETIKKPKFPFLCLLVSGGHTQIIIVRDYLEMEIIGQTIDDAAGEAFDKSAKVMGLPYPGGPHVDREAAKGNPLAFQFNKPHIQNLDFSFSGLKTSFLYVLRDKTLLNKNFIQENLSDLCASLQRTIVEILLEKIEKAAKQTGINQIVIGGGVSANSGLRNGIVEAGIKNGWDTYLPKLKYTTDNAAMIGITSYFKFQKNQFSDQSVSPLARFKNL